MRRLHGGKEAVGSPEMEEVFDLMHGLSHAGPRPTAKAIAQRFVWRNYKKDVNY